MATLEDRLTLAAFNAATEGRGNVKLVWGTYQGTGECGQDHPNTLTFDEKPLWIIIGIGTGTELSLSYGYVSTTVTAGQNTASITALWSENSVTWYSNNYDPGMQKNATGTYHYLALLGL